MSQEDIWNKEYNNPKLITLSNEPQNDVKRFIKYVRKNLKLSLEGLRVLDLGSGTGKNSIFLAERGAAVVGLEISDKALAIAIKRAGDLYSPSPQKELVGVRYLKHDIASPYPFPNQTFDIALDSMSSNSLLDKERRLYLKGTHRVLKPGGLLFVRALCKDGDKHAQTLLQKFPGPEPETYKMPQMNLIERVFSEADFKKTYEKYFSILKLERKSGHSMYNNVTYKRNYWIVYLKKLPL